MKEFLDSHKFDAPTPLTSEGGYKNAAGSFSLKRSLERKVKSRKDLDQPKFSEDDAMKRYYGDFSIEAKRHAWDLLQHHPLFGDTGSIRMNRIHNNTAKVLKNDPLKLIENGGYTVYLHPETNGSKDH